MGLIFERILIVDDHAASAISLAHFCEAVATRIDVSATAREAMRKLDTRVYDFIIVDCRLPDKDGRNLTRWIRGTPGQLNRHTPIVGISADAQYTLERCLEAGMNALVRKPYAPRAVVDLLMSLHGNLRT